MMNKKVIFSSILSLILCMSLIAGSTFALFTSESQTNIAITSGKVEVKATIEDLTMYSLKSIDTATFEGEEVDRTAEGSFLLGGTAAVDGGSLSLTNIMPGDRVEFNINIENSSSVGIQYRTKIVAEDNPLVVTINGDAETRTDWAYKAAGEAIEDVSVAIELPASVEDWMGETIEFDIIVEAIQGNALVYNTVETEDQTGLEAAIAGSDAPTIVELPQGTYKIPAMNGKDITIAGTKDTVIDATQQVAASNSTVTFDGVTIVYDNDAYEGLQHSAKEVYRNCTIKGTMFLYAPEVEFVNCTFEMYDEKTEYSVWTYGATDVSFEGCTFSTHGKAILIYNEETNSNFVADVKVNNCVFVSDGTVDTEKAAIETGSNANNTESSNKYNITITNSMICGFGVSPKGIKTNNTIWSNKNSMDAEHLFVTATGNVEDGARYKDVTTIATAEELFAFADDVNESGNTYAGELVLLTDDIDLKNQEWTPIGQTGATQFKGVLDGQGYTIKNLTVNNTDESKNCASGLFGWIESHGNEGVTVKNLTVDGANVAGHHNVAVIVGYIYGTVENCHVKNAVISCTNANDDANGDKCGLIAGYVGEDATIKGCTAASSTVSAGRDAGQIVGAAKPACVTGCSAANVAVSANNTGTGANIRNNVIGREL